MALSDDLKAYIAKYAKTTMAFDGYYDAVMVGETHAFLNDAMADTSPLADIIAKYADEKMFAAIAREYNEGRLLLIGTTDLDAQRPVIWNIGALATSGKPEALKLFHQILRASAAIPRWNHASGGFGSACTARSAVVRARASSPGPPRDR